MILAALAIGVVLKFNKRDQWTANVISGPRPQPQSRQQEMTQNRSFRDKRLVQFGIRLSPHTIKFAVPNQEPGLVERAPRMSVVR